jgi:hypothetical protein
MIEIYFGENIHFLKFSQIPTVLKRVEAMAQIQNTPACSIAQD